MIAEFLNEEQQMNKDNLIIPLEYTKILVGEDFVASEILIQDTKSQLYAKALQGVSTLYFKNGNEYQGEISRGMMHGKGCMKWQSGIRYEGEFEYNAITGSGEYFWPDGSYYKGQVLSGLRHGVGYYEAEGKQAIYNGEWIDGQRCGKGKIEFPSGAMYEGDFLNGVKHGQGKFKYPSGNIYEGEFFNDMKQGNGTMYWLNSGEKYYGAWEKNLQNGFGCHIWLEAKGEKKQLRNRYEGQWKDGERHGYGVFYYANGSKYEGEWAHNLKSGFAVFTEDNGNLIQGYFKADKLVRNIKDDPIEMSLQFDQQNSVDNESSNMQPDSPLPSNTSSHSPKKITGSKTKLPLGNGRQSIAAVASGSQSQRNRASVIIPASLSGNNNTTINGANAVVSPLSAGQSKKMSMFKPGSIADVGGMDEKAATANGVAATGTMKSSIKQAEKSAQNSSMAGKEIQENPYSTLLDYSDLDYNFTDAKSVHQAVDTVLLRNNSLLIGWFKDCATRFDSALGENSFCMDLGQVWRLIREIKVLGDGVTLAALNRSFFSGVKNKFELRAFESKLEEFNVMKSFGRFLTPEELTDLPLVHFLQGLRLHPLNNLPNTSAFSSMQQISMVEVEDVVGTVGLEQQYSQSAKTRKTHEEKTPVLFRHFADMLVRLAFLRARNPDEIHVELEDIVENHLKTWSGEDKRKVKTAVRSHHEDEAQLLAYLMGKATVIQGNLNDLLQTVFETLKKASKSAKFGSVDETCYLKDLLKLLRETGLLKAEAELHLAQSVIEMTYDPQFTIAHVDTLSRDWEREREREQQKQSSRRNNKAGVKESKKQIAAPVAAPDFAKMKEQRLSRLLNAELIYYEFTRITIAHLIKAVKDSMTTSQKMDDDTLEKRVRHLLEKVVRVAENNQKNSSTVEKKKSAKQWPESVKDLMQQQVGDAKKKVELAKERQRKVELEKERRRRDDERKREQRERAQMMLQDINIPSDIEDDSFDDY